MVSGRTLTPTEARILNLLSDGETHSPQEILVRCIDDELATLQAVYSAMNRLRRRISHLMPEKRIILTRGVGYGIIVR
jgi:DNA-binding response OmpR family regulator